MALYFCRLNTLSLTVPRKFHLITIIARSFCSLLPCHHFPLLEHRHTICSGHLCRPDLFSYKEGRQYKAISGALAGKENYTVCFLVCSPDPVGVLASVVLVFKFPSADSEATTRGQVNRVLLRRLKATSTFLNVDQSTIKLTGKCLRFVFSAWNLFLTLCCSQRNEFHLSMQIWAILVFFFCPLKIVCLTDSIGSWKTEHGKN